MPNKTENITGEVIYLGTRALKPDMPVELALDALRALGNAARLDVFRILVQHEPIGLNAGALTERMGMRHNTMSNHLAVLSRAGLICGTREGRFIQYRACLDGMQSLLGFLMNDCCQGRPEECAQSAPRPDATPCDCAPEPLSPPRRSN